MSTPFDRPVERLGTSRARSTDPGLAARNRTAVPLDDTATVATMFAAAVRDHADATAVVFRGGRVTYAQLQDRVAALAARLRGRGVGAGHIVAIDLDPSPERLAAVLAVLTVGAAYLPVDADAPAARARRMVEDAAASCIIDSGATDGALDVVDGPRAARRCRTATPMPTDAAYVIFTSGSTGRPKGVLVGHRALTNRLTWMGRALAAGPPDRVLHKTAFGFDVSVWEQLLPLTVGASVVVAESEDRRDARALARLMREHAVTVVHFVPTMLAAFVGSGGLERQPDLRAVISSGEALPAVLAQRVVTGCAATLYNLYGPTEATIDVTAWRLERGDPRTFVPLGYPIDNTTIHVLDRWMRPVEAGERGELYLGGVGLAAGYLGQARLTAERFVPDPFGPSGARLYRTGDVVALRPDGIVEFLGRADAQVKLRGHRIEPGEIEHCLLSIEGVRSAAVVRHTDDRRSDALVAHVAADLPTGHVDLPDRLRAALAVELPPYMIPSAFVVHEALPVTASGKLDRAALPPPTYHGSGTTSPTTDAERRLAEVWQELLHLPTVHVEDNFFRAGGDSITAIRLVAAARRRGLDIEVRDVVERPTIAGLAAVAETRAAARTPEHPAPPPRPVAAAAGAPVVMVLIPDDAVSTPALVAALQSGIPGNPQVALVTPADSGGPDPVDAWCRAPQGPGPVRAAVLTLPGVRRIVLAGDPTAADRATLGLLAAEVAAFLTTGRGTLGAAVAHADVLRAATQLPALDTEWLAAVATWAEPARGSVRSSLRRRLRLPKVAGTCPRHLAQGALLAALRATGAGGAVVTLAADREWLARTGWDLRAALGALSTRRRTAVALDRSDLAPVRTVLRRARGLDADDPVGATAPTVRVEWYDLADRAGLWHEDGDRLLAAAGAHSGDDIVLAVVAAADTATACWYGSDAVPYARLTKLADALEQALRELADADPATRADPSDHPLAALDTAEARGIAALGVVDCYRLTPMQEGLLVRALFWAGSDAYHNQNVLELRGPLDRELLERCWAEVAARYEVLRTGFVWEGVRRPVQVVTAADRVSFRHQSWRGCSDVDLDARLDDLLRDDRGQPFDLRHPGPYRIYLVDVGPDRALLVWSHHHILLDGWCLSLIWGDVFALYDAGVRGASLPVRAPRPFRDLVRWLQDKQVSAADTTFWRAYLLGLEVSGRFSDHGPEREGPFETVRIRYDQERSAAVTRLARDRGVTPNAVVQLAWSLLLALRSGQPDVVHGVSVSGRPPELDGVESMVGLFITTLPLRVRIRWDATIGELLDTVQRTLAAANAHAHVPLAEILASWPHRVGQTRLFDSLVAFESYPEDNLPDGPVGGVEVVDRVALEKTEYPLGLIVLPGPQIEFHWNYDTTHFGEAEIRGLIGLFDTLVAGMTVAPAGRLRDLTLLPDGALTAVAGWSRGAEVARSAPSLFAGFARSALATPEAPALVTDTESVTYRELLSQVGAVAERLLDGGAVPGAAVLVALRRGADWVRGVLAVHAVGAVPVLIDVDQPVALIASVTARACAEFAVVDTDGAALVGPLVGRAVRVAGAGSGAAPRRRDHPAGAIVHTSGSTGEPKVVLCPQAGLVNRIEWSARSYRTAGPPRLLLNAGTAFDVVLWELYFPLFTGGAVVVAPPPAELDIAALAETVLRQHISVLHLTPAVLAEFLATPVARRCRCLEVVVTGGETVPPDLVGRFHELGLEAELHQAYGPSEASISVTDRRCGPTDASRSRVPLGGPIDNCHCHVLDPLLRPVPVGVDGELYLGGVGLTAGYLGGPRDTAAAFVPDPFGHEPGGRLYCTGDRATWRPDGALEFRGRRDRQVKVRGQRVELDAVEALLRNRPGGGAAAVTPRTTAAGDTVLTAVVEGTPDGGSTAAAMLAWLRSRLPAAAVPTDVRVVPALPRTPSGKIDRLGIARLAAALEPHAGTRTEPRNPMVRQIAEAWAAELGRTAVGAHQDVFELGATSLSVMRVFGRLRRVLPRGAPTIEVAHLFKAPTPAGLAELLLAPVAGSGADSVATLAAGGVGPPLFLVHPVQGTTSAYRGLRGELGDLDVRAFADPRLGTTAPPFASVTEMAAVYVEWVRALAGTRSPVVGGWSFGGLVALEMATQMRTRGSDVAALILVDSYRPGAHTGLGPGTESGLADDASQLLAETAAHNDALARAWTPTRYPGRVTLLRAGDDVGQLDDRNGWDAATLSALEVVPVDGSHDDLFTPGRVASTARAIRAAVLAAVRTADA